MSKTINDIFSEKIVEVKKSWYNPDALYKPTNADIRLTSNSDLYDNINVPKNSKSFNIDGENYSISVPDDKIRVTNYDLIEQEIIKAKKELKERYDLFFQNYWNNKDTKYSISNIQSLNLNSSNNNNYNITKYSRSDSPNSSIQKFETSPIDTQNKYLSNGEIGGAEWRAVKDTEYLNEMRQADSEARKMASENNLYLTYGQATKSLLGNSLSGMTISTIYGLLRSPALSGYVDSFLGNLGISLSNSTANAFSIGQKDNPITGEVKGETHYSQRLKFASASNTDFLNSIISALRGDASTAIIGGLGAILSLTGYNLGVTSFFGMYQNNAEAWRRTIRLMMFIDSPVFGMRIDNTRREWDNPIFFGTELTTPEKLANSLAKASLRSQGFISNEYDAEYNQSNDFASASLRSERKSTDPDPGELNPGSYKTYGENLAQNSIQSFINNRQNLYNNQTKNRSKQWLIKKSIDFDFGPKEFKSNGEISQLASPRKNDVDFNIYFNLIEVDGVSNDNPKIKIKNRVDLPPTITDFKETTAPTWNEIEYAGRPSTGHVYSGFKKTISFSFYLEAGSPESHVKMFETLSFFENVLRPLGSSYTSGMSGNILLFNMSNLVTNNIVIIDSFEKDIEGPWHLTTGMPLIYKCSISMKVLYDGPVDSGLSINGRIYGHDRYPNFLNNPIVSETKKESGVGNTSNTTNTQMPLSAPPKPANIPYAIGDGMV